MKTVKLTNADLSIFIDDEDYEKVSRHNWFINDNGSSISRNKSGSFYNKRQALASFIMGSNYMYDHKDRNVLNNKKDNFRIATTQQNSFNRSKQKSTTHSKYKGVSWDKSNSSWRAMIRFNGVLKNLGSFKDEILAAIAYDDAAILTFGEYAKLNFELVIY